MPSSSSKKRPFPFDEESKDASEDVETLKSNKSKKSKRKEASSSAGHFILARESNEDNKMAVDKEGIARGDEELTTEDKQALSELLEDVEARKRKKREKRAMREKKIATPAPVETTQDSSIQYLRSWHSDRENWKFKSARELWLVRHYNDLKMVSDEDFKLLVPYLTSMKGQRREVLRHEAKKFTKKFKKEVDDYKTAAKGEDSYAVQYRRASSLRSALKAESE